jgi:phage tail-like protein
VTLAWTAAGLGAAWPVAAGPTGPAGLAFDVNGCLYHGDPDRGQIQRLAWRPVGGRGEQPVDLLSPPPPPPPSGGFRPVTPEAALQVRAVALAGDTDEHLFVLDGTTHAISVLDLADGHLIGSLSLPFPAVDLAAEGRAILVATTSRQHPLVVVDALGLPREATLDERALAALAGVPADARPARVAVGPKGEWWLLLRNAASSWAVPIRDSRRSLPLEVPGASDVELDGRSKLVAAGPGAGKDHPVAFLRRFVLSRAGDEEDVPLSARGYDGRGIVRTPDGRIGFWNGAAFRVAIEAARRYQQSGHVDCYRLDSGTYQQQWGRVFVEACVPPGTALQIGFAVSDDDPGPSEPLGPSIVADPPLVIADGEATDDAVVAPGDPPLVPLALVPIVSRPWPLHRRETGSERPWFRPAPGDSFEVYEAPVQAPPSRYLWLRLMLTGTPKVSPRVRAVRAEFPGHDLLRRLPRAYSRDPVASSFLRRYLAMGDGLLWEMDARAAERQLLLDPFGAPPELLPWLASLVGLTIDGRWPEPARRMVLAEAICLFRRRGTIAGLRRLLQIYLGCTVVIAEAWRMRGAGGAFTGDEPSGPADAVVGFGLRVGGEVGETAGQAGAAPAPDAFATHAHRFSVFVPADLSDEQLQVVQDLLELERPAHTLVQVCAAGRGMRVGVGLHIEVSTVVGPSSGFQRSVVGQSRLGLGTVLGKPRAGVRPGGAHLGLDTLVDP